MSRKCRVMRLGLCDYQEACQLQKQLLRRRIDKEIPDTLVLLQHPPVFTIGRRGSRGNILVGPDVLGREGIAVYNADRGGDVTYHGPGQLVGYPVMDLSQHGTDVLRIIQSYEEVIIKLLGRYGLLGQRVVDYPGVWVGGEKVCAVGIGVSNWVSYHGFALNINTNLSHFGYIVPCGIKGRGVTSLGKITGKTVDEAGVARD
ncbi:MAG: lipoyl(octanoyl) transferase LipB, partial [Desulfocucumaceae bacterium]